MRFYSYLVAAIVVAFMAGPARADVVINEIMYNSPGSPDVEWIELYNNGPDTVQLDDWFFVDNDMAHPHCLLQGHLAAGEYLVVVGDLALFTLVYPEVTALNANDFDADGTGFGLSNGGELLQIFDDDGVLVDAVEYEDGGDWPGSADGDGPSLELVNPAYDNNTASAWDPSVQTGGTPGAINSVFQGNQAPIIHDTDREPRLPMAEELVLISATVSDATDLDRVELMVDLGSGYISVPMYDDGVHGDGAPADSVFAVTVPTIPYQPNGAVVKYYVAAYDEFGNMVTKPSDAPASYRAYTVGYTPSVTLRVNEIMAVNTMTVTDDFGEYEDWLEIHNYGTEAVDLSGMFLTDNLGEHRTWQCPDQELGAGEYLVVWCDNQPEQGSLHASFKFTSDGEGAAIYDTEDHGNTIIDGFQFGLQNEDRSFGHNVIGIVGLPGSRILTDPEPEYLTAPTPGAENELPSSPVVINEFQTTSNYGGVDDWIEFRNRSEMIMDISGWGVSDDLEEPLKWVFPVGTVLDPDEVILVDELELGFSMSSLGEQLLLSSPDGLIGMDFISFGPQLPDVSYGRHTDYSLWAYFTNPSPGEPNIMSLVATPDELPDAVLRLGGAHPNPFNPVTEIHFELPKAVEVEIEIYGLDGRRVRTLRGGVMAAGAQSLVFDGQDDRGRRLASGPFLARVKAGDESGVVRLMMVK